MGNCIAYPTIIRAFRFSSRMGTTLVELLVVISIVGVLFSLLLPAVMACREAVRTLQCQNNLRQIAVALNSLEAATNSYPSNGWGFSWVGEANLGSGNDQPGGWTYSVLPYIEQRNVHQLSSSHDNPTRLGDAAEMQKSKIPLFRCPSRRSMDLEPFAMLRLANSLRPNLAFRGDYAGNGGSIFLDALPGPRDYESARTHKWPAAESFNGVFGPRWRVQSSQVLDGTSHTYLVGEKNVVIGRHGDRGDNQSVYVGDSFDIRRQTHKPPRRDDLVPHPSVFGSRHSSAWNVVLIDGSVHAQSFELDAVVHARMGNRSDGT